jgi:hypothetical protein
MRILRANVTRKPELNTAPEDLDAFLKAHGGLERRLGQDDPLRRRWEPPAHENTQRKPSGFGRRIWNSGLAPVLGLWVGLGYPAACLALLWDWHHPWLLSRYPFIGYAAWISFIGPLAILGIMWRSYAEDS